MGNIDIVCKDYFRDNRIFADSFNYFIYQGRQVISPDQLRELDTNELLIPYGDNADLPVRQNFRDSLKILVAKADRQAAYAILGIEEETNIGYNEPVKIMLYDVLNYNQQLCDARKSYADARNKGPGEGRLQRRPESTSGRSANPIKALTSAEFISGFSKKDRLIPVITLVISLSGHIWDGPTSLHEMFQTKDRSILKYVPDYRINLIDPRQMSEEDFDRFRTELGLILACASASEDKCRLSSLIQDKRYERISRSGACIIEKVTGRKIVKGKGEVINVCKGLQDLIDEEKRKVETEARKQIEIEKNRAEREKQRAEDALRKAETEKQRADLLEARLAAYQDKYGSAF